MHPYFINYLFNDQGAHNCIKNCTCWILNVYRKLTIVGLNIWSIFDLNVYRCHRKKQTICNWKQYTCHYMLMIFRSTLNEDVFAPQHREEKMQHPNIEEITGQIHKLLLQVWYLFIIYLYTDIHTLMWEADNLGLQLQFGSELPSLSNALIKHEVTWPYHIVMMVSVVLIDIATPRLIWAYGRSRREGRDYGQIGWCCKWQAVRGDPQDLPFSNVAPQQKKWWEWFMGMMCNLLCWFPHLLCLWEARKGSCKWRLHNTAHCNMMIASQAPDHPDWIHVTAGELW